MSVCEFLESHKGSLIARDHAILEKACSILLKNIAPVTKETLWSPYKVITPSLAPRPDKTDELFFPGMWNWDTAFHAIAAARFDKTLAQHQMLAFFLFQGKNGMLPDVVRMPCAKNEIMDAYTKPPVWAWAMEMLDRRAPDDEFLSEMYPKLVLNESFWRKERYSEADGLFFYSTSEKGDMRDTYIRWETGLDDSIRFDGGVAEFLYPVDLNCFMISFYKSMQYLALRQNLCDDAEKWHSREKALEEKIQATLFCESDGCFFDWNFKEKEFVRVITPAIFMPLWAGIATRSQAERAHTYARDEKKLYPCMPTVAFDHPKFDATGYWRGSVWMNTAYFAIKGLYDYGFTATAKEIKNTLLTWMSQNETIYENYNPITGQGKCAPDFSWSCVFAIEMVLEII